MKLDVSVAPEIAVLAGHAAAGAATASPESPAAASATIGQLAACLRILVADPRTWWDLVRFDPQRPVRVPVAAPRPGCAAWLLILPPGSHDDAAAPGLPGEVEAPGLPGDAAVPGPPAVAEPGAGGEEAACLIAGAMVDQVSTSAGWQHRALTPGRTWVRGGAGPYRLVNTGGGYAVSLHVRSARPVPAPARPAPAPARPAPTPAA